jgi:Tol biopolymer transport system component
VDFSSDGDELIYLGVGDAGSVTGIYRLSLPGEQSTLLYTPPAEEQITFVTLSPDGKWLLFTDQTSLSLFRIPAAGGEKETIYEFTGTTMSVNYEPDGNYMVVLDLSQEAQTLKLFNTNLEEVTSVEPIGSGYLAFSPDGRMFAYQLPVETQMVLYVSDLEQDAVYTIDNIAQLYQPQFTRDGTQVLYIRYADRASKFGELVLASVDGSTTSLVDQNVTSFLIRNDGSIVYMKYDQDAFTSTLIKVDSSGLNPIILDGPFPGTASITK